MTLKASATKYICDIIQSKTVPAAKTISSRAGSASHVSDKILAPRQCEELGNSVTKKQEKTNLYHRPRTCITLSPKMMCHCAMIAWQGLGIISRQGNAQRKGRTAVSPTYRGRRRRGRRGCAEIRPHPQLGGWGCQPVQPLRKSVCSPRARRDPRGRVTQQLRPQGRPRRKERVSAQGLADKGSQQHDSQRPTRGRPQHPSLKTDKQRGRPHGGRSHSASEGGAAPRAHWGGRLTAECCTPLVQGARGRQTPTAAAAPGGPAGGGFGGTRGAVPPGADFLSGRWKRPELDCGGGCATLKTVKPIQLHTSVGE